MRIKIFIIIILTLINISMISASEIEKNNYSYVEIITPIKTVYDDGVYRVVFSAFSLYNESDEKILDCGEVYDYATIIKVPHGTYKIKFYNDKGELIERKFTTDDKKFINIILNIE